MWILWLIIIILLVFLEVITINLVSIWFIASAVFSLFLSFYVDSFYIQFAVFVILGLILMALTRPYFIKKFNQNRAKTNLDRVIGMEGIVSAEITKNKVGEVKVDGKTWSAVLSNHDKKKIGVGEIVIIEEIDGVKLIVRKGEE